jgi:hypothetical protein
MPVTTHHQYLDLYPIHPESTRLIIGTIHPHRVDNFEIDFYYGNRGSFWNILSDAFPHQNFGNLRDILETLEQYGVSVTDMIQQCDREHENITADHALYNLVLNQEPISIGIQNSKIDTIYFTSRFSKNNAAQLFTRCFHINYRDTFNEASSEFTIPQWVFGRVIRAVVLYSPSGQSNVGVSRSAPFLNNIDYYQQFLRPVRQFKKEFYQQKFAFFGQ